ncbi:MAG: hypothetical protein E3J60_04575 [Dehalococcoidia bacterium]|nr:MAG: hypothetical protein E3J60_04575 [Dehalococcoidia bacterium]
MQYPSYSALDDSTLVGAILKKYPGYNTSLLPEIPPSKVSSPGTISQFFNRALLQPLHTIGLAAAEGQAGWLKAMDAFTVYLEDKFGIPRGGAFKDLSNLWDKWAEKHKGKDIPREGFIGEVAHALYYGMGRLGTDLPVISQTGLVTYMATMGAGESIQRGESPAIGALKGGAQGALLHGSLKGLAVLPRVPAMAGGAVVFGVPSAVSELQVPAEQREWGRVAGDAMLGAGLMALGQKPTQEQFRAMRIREPVKQEVGVKLPVEYPTEKPVEPPMRPVEYVKPEIRPEVPVEGVKPVEARKRLTVEGERMEIQETAKNRLRDISDKHPQQTVGWDATDAMSVGIKESEIKTFADQYGQGKATAILTKSVQNLTDAAAKTDALIRKMDTANLTSKDIIGFQDQLSKSLESVFEPARQISAEAGRILQKHQKYTKPQMEALKKIGEIPPESRAEWERVIDLYKRIDPSNPREFAQFLRNTEKPTFREYMWEFWYNCILSGPPTHLVNTISNTTWQAFQTPWRAIRAVVDIPVAKFQGRQREYYLREIAPMWIGYKTGIKTAVPKVLKLIRTGELQSDMTKWGIDIGKSLESFARSPSAIARVAAPAVSFPSRMLRAEDVFFRSIAYDAEIGATAMRTALKEGLRGDKLNVRFAELKQNPTDAMMKAAGKFSDYTTFMDALGKVGSSIISLRNQIPGGRFIIPFVRTPGNLMKRGVELTPGIGVALQRKQLRGQELSSVITNQIAGTLIATYFATKYLDGELVGAAPKSPSERERFYAQGKLPWSVQIGNHWISYRRIEPFGTPIAMVAIVGDAWRDRGKAPTSESITKMGMEFGRYLLDVSYVSQLSDLLENISRGDGGYTAMRRFGQRFPTSFVPYSSFLRSMGRATEAVKTGKVVLRDPKTVSEATRAQIPFLTETVPARKTVFGQEILLPGGPIRQWLPYKASKATKDPVELELQRLGISPGMPAKKIRGTELTDEQYDRYLTLSGEAIYKELKRVITSKAWVDAKDTLEANQAKDKIIESIIRRIREAVRGKILVEIAQDKMPGGVE